MDKISSLHQGSGTSDIPAILNHTVGSSPVQRGSQHECTLWTVPFRVSFMSGQSRIVSRSGDAHAYPPSSLPVFPPRPLPGAPPAAWGISQDLNLPCPCPQGRFEQSSDMSGLCVPRTAQTTDGTEGAGQVDWEGAAAAPSQETEAWETL